MNFADKLINAIKEKKSPICVGIDPRFEQIPEFIKEKYRKKHGKTFKAAANAFLEFNKGIIDAIADIVPIVKPQSAFYEQYGHEGIKALEETITYAQSKGLLVLLDAKRNDIGSTSAAYSSAILGRVDVFGEEQSGFDADALTINPYLGSDGIKPFIDDCDKYDKGIFILVKTSNPSSGEIQDLHVGAGIAPAQSNANNYSPKKTYEHIATLVNTWGDDLIGESGYSSVGAVVGATYPEQAKKLRSQLPRTIFLVPGYGAQGGSVKDVLPCFNSDGTGAIINNSRGIIFAYEKDGKYSPQDFAQAARDATIRMRKELNQKMI